MVVLVPNSITQIIPAFIATSKIFLCDLQLLKREPIHSDICGIADIPIIKSWKNSGKHLLDSHLCWGWAVYNIPVVLYCDDNVIFWYANLSFKLTANTFYFKTLTKWCQRVSVSCYIQVYLKCTFHVYCWHHTCFPTTRYDEYCFNPSMRFLCFKSILTPL